MTQPMVRGDAARRAAVRPLAVACLILLASLLMAASLAVGLPSVARADELEPEASESVTAGESDSSGDEVSEEGEGEEEKAEGQPDDGLPHLQEAQAAIICDGQGEVLWSLNPELELQPASITKVMTAMVALDSGIDLDKPVKVVAEPPSGNSQTAGFAVGDTTTMRDLLYATLVYSGNDAALNVATLVGGSEQIFVALMNQRAAELGMTHTHFVNPHGLEAEGHHSCVADLVVMGRYALEHYPFIAEAVQKRSVDIKIGKYTTTLESTDELMEIYDGLLGIKTGAVESGAGFLGASKRDGVTLYTAVLGCPTGEGRFIDTAALMDWAYGKLYHWRTFAKAGSPLRVLPSALDFSARRIVWAPESVAAYAKGEGELSYLSARTDAHHLADAGMPYGSIVWEQNGRLAGATALTASGELYRAPALNSFALPLFESTLQERAA